MKIFTDGACSSNGKSHARAGCGVYIQGTREEFSLSLDEAKKICNITCEIKDTNNTGELLAILCAFYLCRDKELVIYTDSMYSINCITVWNNNWIKNNWMTSTGKVVKNRALIEAIINKKKNFNVIFIHVNSHRKEPDASSLDHENWFGNDKADMLATRAIASKN